MYFCMKNSPASEDDFLEDLLTVVDHYQVKNNFLLPFERALPHKCSKHHSEILLLLRWLKTVSSTFQDLDFDVSL